MIPNEGNQSSFQVCPNFFTMTSWSSSSKPSPFSSFLTFPIITTEKLVGSVNYSSWVASVELQFMEQGVDDHLTSKPEDVEVSEIDKTTWTKTDALLCNSMQLFIDPQLYPIYKTYKTSYEIWNQAKLLLYC